ncbi:MAG: envelope biogenesis factor ElyC [Pseudomonadota bacterium]
MFFLKKLVAPLFFPVPLLLLALLAGLVMLWFTRRRRLGLTLASLAAAVLVLLSYGPVANALLAPLEYRYPPFDPAALQDPAAPPIRWVVVLGGGQVSDPRVPATSQLTASSLARLVEGIRLQRQLPGTRLLLSGGPVFNPVAEADGMAQLALALGVPRTDLALDRLSMDTEEQARRLQPILGRDRFVLVTSAAHMPRAVALFRKRGLAPIPAPTDYLAKEPQAFSPAMLYPSAVSLRKAERAAHEYLGLAWAKLRGAV